MELVNKLAEDYSLLFTSKADEALYNFHQQIINNHPQQHLQSSWTQGMFLSFISKCLQPKYILEIGTFTGFSAMCLAKGLQANGELHTIELREEDAQKSLTNFKHSPNSNQIHLHLGNALEIIPALPHHWDLVFIDADKTSYTEYYKMIKPKLNAKGIIIADNVLFHGQVLEEELKGKNAKAIHDFNNYVANDDDVEQVMLTVRDGLTLIRRKF